MHPPTRASCALERVFSGHEGAAHPSGTCGYDEPLPNQTWLQFPVAGSAAYEDGDCLYPNDLGAAEIARAVLGSLPNGPPPADTTPPATSFKARNPALLVSARFDKLRGSSVDEAAGVASVDVTLISATGAQTTIHPALACTPNRRTCTFEVSPPGPGTFTVTARAIDRAGPPNQEAFGSQL